MNFLPTENLSSHNNSTIEICMSLEVKSDLLCPVYVLISKCNAHAIFPAWHHARPHRTSKLHMLIIAGTNYA